MLHSVQQEPALSGENYGMSGIVIARVDRENACYFYRLNAVMITSTK